MLDIVTEQVIQALVEVVWNRPELDNLREPVEKMLKGNEFKKLTQNAMKFLADSSAETLPDLFDPGFIRMPEVQNHLAEYIVHGNEANVDRLTELYAKRFLKPKDAEDISGYLHAYLVRLRETFSGHPQFGPILVSRDLRDIKQGIKDLTEILDSLVDEPEVKALKARKSGILQKWNSGILRVLNASIMLPHFDTLLAAGLIAAAQQTSTRDSTLLITGMGVTEIRVLISTLADESGDSISNEEICQRIQYAINQSNVVDMMRLPQPRALMVSRLRELNVFEYLLENNAYTVVSRLTRQFSFPGKRLFLSYARSDDTGLEPNSFVKRIYSDLIGRGYDVWWDRISMTDRGETFLDSIADAISQSDRLLLVCGPGAFKSEYVRAEWEHAQSRCIPIKPLLYKGDYSDLPPEIASVDGVDFRDSEKYIERLEYLLRQFDEALRSPGKLLGTPPSLPPHYVPRTSEIYEIRSKLLVDSHEAIRLKDVQRKIGIHGMGGVGKSVLATSLIRDCEMRRKFYDGILWVTLGSSPKLEARLSSLCHALGQSLQPFADVQQGSATLKQLLQDKHCLLIVDDVWQKSHLEAFDVIGDYSALVFTTRDVGLITAIGAQSHDVSLLSMGEAKHLVALQLLDQVEKTETLLETTKSELPLEAEDVITECGNLPLAISVCAAMVRDGTTWTDLLDALRDRDIEYLEHQNGNVMKSIRVSLESLVPDNKTRNDEFVARYMELSVFPENIGIPVAAIETLWTESGSMKSRHVNKLLATLRGRALLKLDEKNNIVTLHSLHYDFICGGIADTALVHNMLLNAYKKKCNGGWHTGPNDGYFFENLAYHLRQLNRFDELVELLTGSSDWMEAKFKACRGNASYSFDLDVAIELCDALPPIQRELTLVKLFTAKQVVWKQVETIRNRDLSLLTRLGRKEEALNHVRLRSRGIDQFNGLKIVYQTLKGMNQPDFALLEEMFAIADAIPIMMIRVQALCELGEYDTQYFDHALKHANEALDRLYATNFDQETMLTLLATQGFWALAQVAASLKKIEDVRSIKLLDDVRDFVEAIEDEGTQALYIILLSSIGALPEDMINHSLDAIVKAVNERDNWMNSGGWLVGFIQLMLQMALITRKRYRDALQFVRILKNPNSAALFLSVLVSSLSEAQQTEEHEHLYELLNELLNNPLSAPQTKSIVGMAYAELGELETAEKVFIGLGDNNVRWSVLNSISSKYSQGNEFDTALQYAERIEDQFEQSEALFTLAESLAMNGDHTRASQIYSRASILAQESAYDDSRISAIEQIAVLAASFEQIEMAKTLLSCIDRIEARIIALSSVALATASTRSNAIVDIMSELEAEIDEIRSPLAHATTMANLIGVLDKLDVNRANSLYNRTLGEVMRIPNSNERAIALAKLGAIQYERRGEKSELLDRAIDLARNLDNLSDRSVVLSEILEELIQIQDDRIEQVFAESYSSLFELLNNSELIDAFDQKNSIVMRQASRMNRMTIRIIIIGSGEKVDQVREVLDWLAHTDQSGDYVMRQDLATRVFLKETDILGALKRLGPQNLDDYVHLLSGWSSGFEAVSDKLTLRILTEAIRIISWVRFDWRPVAEVLEKYGEHNDT
jgi:tetratricopeptide (TPR) repeat protein